MAFAIERFTAFGVTFPNPKDVELLEKLTDKSSMADCVALGAKACKLEMTVHGYEDVAVFTDIVVEHRKKKWYPVCRFHTWNEGTLCPSDTTVLLVKEASIPLIPVVVSA